MDLTVIATGSTGNCYLLEGRSSALIIECGATPERVMHATACPMSRIAGCIISHEHGDHAAYAGRYANLGLDVYASRGTLKAMGAEGGRYHALQPMVSSWLGDFLVRPFPVHHDAAEPMGFLIEHSEMGRLLFVTDTRQVDYTFRTYNVSHIMVEANWSDEAMEESILSGRMDGGRARRVQDTHLSLRAACELVKANETAALQTVTMIHLSSGNSDADKFERTMRGSVRLADVYVASAGLRIPLNKDFELK